MISKIILPFKKEKVAKTVSKPQKCQNNYIKVQFENPRQIYQTTFETYLPQTMFWNWIFMWKCNKFKQKVAQNVAISFGY